MNIILSENEYKELEDSYIKEEHNLYIYKVFKLVKERYFPEKKLSNEFYYESLSAKIAEISPAMKQEREKMNITNRDSILIDCQFIFECLTIT